MENKASARLWLGIVNFILGIIGLAVIISFIRSVISPTHAKEIISTLMFAFKCFTVALCAYFIIGD